MGDRHCHVAMDLDNGSYRLTRRALERRARLGGGFEAYAADEHSLGLFPTPREAAAAIIMARPWVARTTATELAQGGK
jgi:hypothetical protein